MTNANVIGVGDDPTIEAAIRFLCRHENHFTLITSNDDVVIYSACDRPKDSELLRLGKGPTLREALMDACRYVNECRRLP